MLEIIGLALFSVITAVAAFFVGDRQGQSKGKRKERERAMRADHEQANEVRRRVDAARHVDITDVVDRLRDNGFLRSGGKSDS